MSTAKITALIARFCGVPVADIKPEMELLQDLNLDSLDCVELAMAIETEFDISISDDEFAKIETAQGVIDLVSGILGTGSTNLNHNKERTA